MRAVLLALLLPAALLAEDASPHAEADRLWSARAEGSSGGRAAASAVDPLVEACRAGAAKEPASVEWRWRLMRALHFRGEHVANDVETKRAVFDEGRKAAEEALAILRREASAASGKDLAKATPVELAPHLKGRADAVAAFYWAAADLGKWALAFGKSAAVKQGAAAKIRDYSEAVILLDPGYDGGGGYRILGRLHHQTPSVPFFTGWASRSEALKNLRLAVKTDPTNALGREFLAEAVWDYDAAHREQAVALLKALVAETPPPELLVEVRRAQEDAAARLKEWGR